MTDRMHEHNAVTHQQQNDIVVYHQKAFLDLS